MPQEANQLKLTILSIALLLVITACGGSDEDSSKSGSNVRSAPAISAPALGIRSEDGGAPGTEGAIWTRQFGTEQDEQSEGIAVDKDGNIYILGTTSGELSGQTAFGYSDAWVRKYDSDGNDLWTNQFGSEGADAAYSGDTDGEGNLYVVGRTAKTLTSAESLGSFDAFLKKYSPDGSELFTKQFGTSGRDQAIGVQVSDQGSVYAFGETRGTIEGQSSLGKQDVFLIQFDSEGQIGWSKQLGSPETDTAEDIFVGSDGSIYLAGTTLGEMDTSLGKTSTDNDAYIVKFDPDGNQNWVRQFGSGEAQSDAAFAVTADQDGNVIVAGRTSGELPEKSTWGSFDAFVRKYDSSGTEIWTKQFGSDQGLLDDDDAYGLATDSSGNIYVSGATIGHLPGMTSFRLSDVWIRKYDPEGSEVWTYQFGSDEADEGLGIAVSADSVYVTGKTSGILPGLPETTLCIDKLDPAATCKLKDPFLRKYSID